MIRVSRCTKCPAFGAGRCGIEKREVMTDLRKAPPVWCPLREGDVTITLDEK